MVHDPEERTVNVSQSELFMDGELVKRRAIALGNCRNTERPIDKYDQHLSGRLYKATVVFPTRDTKFREIEICVRSAGCKVFYDDKVDKMLAMRSEEGAAFCGIVNLYRLGGLTHRFYTKKGFLAHFEKCAKAQEKWFEDFNRHRLTSWTLN